MSEKFTFLDVRVIERKICIHDQLGILKEYSLSFSRFSKYKLYNSIWQTALMECTYVHETTLQINN